MNTRHPDERVRKAINDLNDALFDYHKTSESEVALIIRQANWSHRSFNGKENVPDGVSDEDLIIQVTT
jgi:hypothetical protein